MTTNSWGPPFREPCGGWYSGHRWFLGPMYQHFSKGESGLQKWKNTSQRDKLGSWSDPFPRYSTSNPQCNPYDAPCGLPWEQEMQVCSGTSLFLTIPNGIYFNCFHQLTGQVVDMSSCHKYGFKNVYAKKYWHGRLSYTNRENKGGGGTNASIPNENYHGLFPDDMAWCGTCRAHDYDSGPSDVRYLTVSGRVDIVLSGWTYTGGGEEELIFSGYVESQASAKSGIYNGRIEVHCSSGEIPVDYPVYYQHLYTEANLKLDKTANSSHNYLFESYITQLQAIRDANPSVEPYIQKLGNNSYLVEFSGNDNHVPPQLDTRYSLEITPSSYTYIERGAVYESGSIPITGWDVVCKDYLTYTDTHVHRESKTRMCSSEDFGFVTTIDAYLSDPYYESQVRQSITDLLSQWDLTNDKIYPWRNDSNVKNGPLVSYDEVYAYPTIPQCVNLNTGTTAQILGKPHSCHGAPFWDDKFENYSWDVDSQKYTLDSYGAYSDDQLGLPHSATQWTNELESRIDPGLPPYAHLQHSYTAHGDIVYASKWAETQVRRPSVNYSRPCGTDRLQVDTDSYCINSIDAGTKTLSFIDYPTGIEDKDECVVCGTESLDGLWKISKSDYLYADTLVLESLLMGIDSFDALGLEPIQKCVLCGGGTGIIAKLRWPTSGIKPLCGNSTTVLSATNTNPIMLTLEKPGVFLSGDKIYVKNMGDLTAANGYKTIGGSGITPYIIPLSGTTGVGQPTYSALGGYIEIVSDYVDAWNDNGFKGDYGVVAWETNFRDMGEYVRISGQNEWLKTDWKCGEIDGEGNPVYCFGGSDLPPGGNPRSLQSQWGLNQEVTSVSCSGSCLQFVPCCPMVICISPNGEDFAKSQLDSFDSYIVTEQGDYIVMEDGTPFIIEKNALGGKTYPFPTGFRLDSQYGAYWAAQVTQHTVDPFWVKPPTPCYYNESYNLHIDNWIQDDGSCLADVIDPCTGYYPYPPMVEFRCSQPDGSPTLKAGCYIGVLPQGSVNIATHPLGIVSNYPFNGDPKDYPNSFPYLPWVVYNAETVCACNHGQFDLDYAGNGIYCTHL